MSAPRARWQKIPPRTHARAQMQISRRGATCRAPIRGGGARAEQHAPPVGAARARAPRNAARGMAGGRSVKTVRVLCDGCEAAGANVYCRACRACACDACRARLHAAPACALGFESLGQCLGVLALCAACGKRPAMVCCAREERGGGSVCVRAADSLGCLCVAPEYQGGERRL